MVLFFIGLFVGAGFGFIVSTVLTASKAEDAARDKREKRDK